MIVYPRFKKKKTKAKNLEAFMVLLILLQVKGVSLKSLESICTCVSFFPVAIIILVTNEWWHLIAYKHILRSGDGCYYSFGKCSKFLPGIDMITACASCYHGSPSRRPRGHVGGPSLCSTGFMYIQSLRGENPKCSMQKSYNIVGTDPFCPLHGVKVWSLSQLGWWNSWW